MDTLVAWLWQGALLTTAVAVSLRLATRASAATRHAIWWMTLACVLAIPALHALGGKLQAAPGDAVHDSIAPAVVPLAWSLPAPPDWVMAVLLGAWLGTVLLASMRIARSVLHVRRLADAAVPIAPDVEASLVAWSRERTSGRAMGLRLSDDVAVPCALGLGRAVVLIPRALAQRLDAEDLDRLVMHERAHLLRHDDWLRLLEAAISAVASFLPAVAWLTRQIDLDRETACDDYVVTVTGDARGYATCLADAAAALHGARSGGLPRLAPGALRSRGALERRVVRIVDHRARRSPASLAVVAACTSGIACATLLFAQASPLVRFEPGVPEDRAQIPWQPSDLAERREVRVANNSPTPSSQPEPVASRPRSAVSAPPAAVVGAGGPAAADSGSSRSAGQAPADGSQREPEPRPAAGEPSPSAHELSSALPVDPGTRPVLVGGPVTPGATSAPVGSNRSPWGDVAQAGVNVGVGAKKAGIAVGGFFGRAGKAIGDSF